MCLGTPDSDTLVAVRPSGGEESPLNKDAVVGEGICIPMEWFSGSMRIHRGALEQVCLRVSPELATTISDDAVRGGMERDWRVLAARTTAAEGRLSCTGLADLSAAFRMRAPRCCRCHSGELSTLFCTPTIEI